MLSDSQSERDLTVTLVTRSSVARSAPAGMCPGARGHTVSTGVTAGLASLANVYWQTGGVGPVQAVAGLAVTRVAALQVDTEAVLEGAVMAVRTSDLSTLVNILTVSSIALQTTVSQSQLTTVSTSLTWNPSSQWQE